MRQCSIIDLDKSYRNLSDKEIINKCIKVLEKRRTVYKIVKNHRNRYGPLYHYNIEYVIGQKYHIDKLDIKIDNLLDNISLDNGFYSYTNLEDVKHDKSTIFMGTYYSILECTIPKGSKIIEDRELAISDTIIIKKEIIMGFRKYINYKKFDEKKIRNKYVKKLKKNKKVYKIVMVRSSSIVTTPPIDGFIYVYDIGKLYHIPKINTIIEDDHIDVETEGGFHVYTDLENAKQLLSTFYEGKNNYAIAECTCPSSSEFIENNILTAVSNAMIINKIVK